MVFVSAYLIYHQCRPLPNSPIILDFDPKVSKKQAENIYFALKVSRNVSWIDHMKYRTSSTLLSFSGFFKRFLFHHFMSPLSVFNCLSTKVHAVCKYNALSTSRTELYATLDDTCHVRSWYEPPICSVQCLQMNFIMNIFS